MEEEKRIYVKGLAFAILGTVVLSFDALLIRLSGTGGIGVVFYRALFTCISSSVLFFGTTRRKALPILGSGGLPMLISGLMWGFGGIGFTLGVKSAGAANTLVLISLSPLFAALFSAVFYKKRPSLSTIVATCLSIFGVWFMYREGFGDMEVQGILFALSAPLFLGSNLAFMRNHTEMARLPLVMIGGLTGSLFALVVSRGNLRIPPESLFPLALLGLLVIPFSQTMIGTGTPYINAPEAALINSSETVLGIFYVWLFLQEAPTLDFMIGASIVVLSITLHSLYQVKTKKM